MKIYIVKVTPEAAVSKISQEGYLSFDLAKAFIESRVPTPTPRMSFVWQDENYTKYEIVEAQINVQT